MRPGDGTKVDGKPHNEYDALVTAEIAWVLGRRAGATRIRGLGEYAASAHGLGGSGTERFQRLASTLWLESFFRSAFASNSIDLAGLAVNSAGPVSGLARTYASLNPRFSGSLTGAADAAAAAAAPAPAGGAALAAKDCGLFVLESGPFLRGKLYSDGLFRDKDGGDIPRNLGDELAFEALYAKMASMNMMDWTPDGLVLSKLEGPTGDQAGSQAIDAKQAQLFNICVQGPALARSWTGQPLLQCMPMDKVFVVVVADVSTELGIAQGVSVNYADPAGDAYVRVIVDLHKKLADRNEKAGAAREAAQTLLDAAVDAREAYFATGATKVEKDAFEADWQSKAVAMRYGNTAEKSVMTNFKLMRTTSAHLSQYSGAGSQEHPRCGLRRGKNGARYTAEYIVGGWCIGTVLDNSASRASVGNVTRTAPSSMALNVNVGVEWWSGDKLYRHYMDNGVEQRSGRPGQDIARAAPMGAGDRQRVISADDGDGK